MSELNRKVINATKWSGITEIAAKMVAPVTTMVLARLLTPDAFGVLVTAQMVISFAEIFTDAGFQKYIIQHEFTDEDDKNKSVTVAFWSNLIFSILTCIIICIFSNSIARLVGCDGDGLVIAVSSVCIPLTAFSSIQIGIFKRNLDFKTLFGVRMIGIMIPIILTIPLAYITKSYWALIIGMIALNLSNAVLLTIKSKWKPKFYYNLKRFKQMFSFTAWSMIESISIWSTTYLDLFIVGTMLNQYYLGLYRTSMVTVGQITSVITAATTPVLFASLSRLQTDKNSFEKFFLSFQKIVSFFVIPIGIGIFCYSDLLTNILLGSQWKEASNFIGLWGLTSSITIIFSHYSCEVYRSKGKPKLSVISQVIHIAFLLPTVYISVKYGFDVLCNARALVRIQGVVTDIFIMSFIIGISLRKMFMNIYKILIASITMAVVCLSLEFNTYSNIFQILSIIICIIIYCSIIALFKNERTEITNLIKTYIKKK